MDVQVNLEPLPHVDTGGGFREVKAEITIDSTQPRWRQRQAVIYETAASMLSSVLSHEAIIDLTIAIGDALDQWEGLADQIGEDNAKTVTA